jgi:hypothetical protein
MGFAVGIPYFRIREDIFRETIAGIRASSRRPDRFIIVVNGGTLPSIPDLGALVLFQRSNIGVAASWNLIMRTAKRDPAITQVVLLNDDCKVAPDSLAKLVDDPWSVVLAHWFSCWKLAMRTWEEVGPFDEQFWPAYFEDADYRARLDRAGIVPVEWPMEETATAIPGRTRKPSGIEHGFWAGPHEHRGWHGEQLAVFNRCIEANRARVVAKWNADPDELKWNKADGPNAYREPFNGAPDPGIGGRSVPNASILDREIPRVPTKTLPPPAATKRPSVTGAGKGRRAFHSGLAGRRRPGSDGR